MSEDGLATLVEHLSSSHYGTQRQKWNFTTEPCLGWAVITASGLMPLCMGFRISGTRPAVTHAQGYAPQGILHGSQC